MIGRVLRLLLVGVGLIGCSPVPAYHGDFRVRPEDIAARVQCELKIAAKLYSTKTVNLNDFAAGYTLGLKVETEVGPNVKGDWVIPYHLTDTFTGGLVAGMTDNVVRDGSIKFLFPIAPLQKYACPLYLDHAYREDIETANISYGSFGLIDWFANITRASSPDNLAITSQMDYTVKFGVTGSATASPGFKIVNLTGAVNLPLKRVDTHTLIVAFTRILAEPKPTKVCITNLPDAAPCKQEIEKKAIEELRKEEGKSRRPSRPARAPGLSPETQQQLNQQLDLLRLRDILRP
jgi:hypothetical protein